MTDQLPTLPPTLPKSILKIRKVTKSSFIRGIAYNRVLQELTIEMGSNMYVYYDVDWSTAKTLWQAKSYGKTYNKLIKGQFRGQKL